MLIIAPSCRQERFAPQLAFASTLASEWPHAFNLLVTAQAVEARELEADTALGSQVMSLTYKKC